MFSKTSKWWLLEGVRNGKYPHLRIGRQIRFTEQHITEIAELLEIRPAAPAPVEAAPEVSVFNVTPRSAARHRTRKSA